MAKPPKRFDINLTPAEVLYLNKLGLRTREDLPKAAIPLPSVAWDADPKRLSATGSREMTKMWMRYFAGMVAASGRQHGRDDGLVVLMKPTFTQEPFGVTAYCSRPDVIQPLKTKQGLDRFGSDPAYALPDIVFKVSLVETLCPVVFLWREATKDVLVSNEHQVKNPDYFLAIDRVDTTSGFLNFIGVLELLQLADAAEPYFARLSALMRDAIDARSDEWLRWLSHLVEKRVIFSGAHIFVDARNPERYFYNYSGHH